MSVAAIVVAACAGCGAGPSFRPPVAEREPGQGSAPAATTTSGPPPPPALSAPKADVAWTDCTRQTLGGLGLSGGPAGLAFDCAQLSVPVDAEGAIYGAATVGLVRARLPQTPAKAAPIVLTSGVDRASSTTLAEWAVGPSTALLAAHPVVAIDRRGIGASAPLVCLPPDVRQGIADNAQAAPGGDQVAALASLSEQGTTACKDFLQPQELTLDAAHAADDIDALRQQWRVDRVGLIGAGNGALVAAAYAQKYGAHLGRLVLDSPWPLGADQVTLTEQRVQGREAALTAFAQRCAGLRCSLGPDPKAAVLDLVHRAGGGQLPGVSANSLLTALAGYLGSPKEQSDDRTAQLADALSAAGRGDTARLQQLIDHEAAETATDGQFIADCSDEQQRAPVAQARDLRAAWSAKYPVFGDAAAVAMVRCTAWPTITLPPPPSKLDGLPVLVLGGAADPVVGNAGLSKVTGMFDAAGARTAVINWLGYGHLVFAHSPGCAAAPVVAYLDTGTLPVNGLACPA
jgi:pimeloyl-ACP methyl ester carboxylesterase